ncbi:MAG: TolB family protein [Bacilli bacterium]
MKRLFLMMMFIGSLIVANVQPAHANLGKSNNLAVATERELLIIDSGTGQTKAKIVGQGITHPKWNATNEQLAYLTNGMLYVAKANGTLRTRVATGVRPDDFVWLSETELAYSVEGSGMFRYNVTTKLDNRIGQASLNYICLQRLNETTVVATAMTPGKQEGKLVQIDAQNNRSITLVAGKPVGQGFYGLGMFPVVMRIAADSSQAIIAELPFSGSTTRDGVPLGLYNFQSNRYSPIEQSQTIGLAYTDFYSFSSQFETFAFMKGGDRMLTTRKTLMLRNSSGRVKAITSTKETAMSPVFSRDGNFLYYSASPLKSNDQVENWLKRSGHSIYRYDVRTGQKKLMTSGKKGFDFSPFAVEENSFYFLRVATNRQVTLWRSQAGKETQIAVLERDWNKSNLMYYGYWPKEAFIGE